MNILCFVVRFTVEPFSTNIELQIRIKNSGKSNLFLIDSNDFVQIIDVHLHFQ